MRKGFDAAVVKQRIVEWIRNWFKANGDGCYAVIGISGGKDSSVVAALCVEALGADRVVGVLMPNGVQADIEDSRRVVSSLGIVHYEVNIEQSVSEMLKLVQDHVGMVSKQTKINVPPRIRMTTLYAISQSIDGRVANTCNLSETFVGYETRWGDSVGDFAPIVNLTTDEVIAVGLLCDKLPRDLVLKTPSDGLCGKTDEESFGFTYDQLNAYIWGTATVPEEIGSKIQDMFEKSRFKRMPIPAYDER